MREGGLPVAAGENLHSLYEFQALIAAGGVTFPEPDLSNCGGVSVWLKVARLAEAANLPVTSHGVHDLHVHLLAAVPNASYLEVHGFGLERFMAEPLVIRDGRAIAPERPGHGVELDWQALGAAARVIDVTLRRLRPMTARRASGRQARCCLPGRPRLDSDQWRARAEAARQGA